MCNHNIPRSSLAVYPSICSVFSNTFRPKLKAHMKWLRKQSLRKRHFPLPFLASQIKHAEVKCYFVFSSRAFQSQTTVSEENDPGENEYQNGNLSFSETGKYDDYLTQSPRVTGNNDKCIEIIIC